MAFAGIGTNRGSTTAIHADEFGEGGTGTGLTASSEEMKSQKEKSEAEAKDQADGGLRILDRGILKGLYKRLQMRTEVPGIMTLRSNRSLGVIVGPNSLTEANFPVNAVVYIRWRGMSRPEVGEVFTVYTPAVVLQNKTDFSDFKIRQNSLDAKGDLDRFNHAGYLYEENGEIEIVDVSRGVVKARVIRNVSQIFINDHIMAALPKITKIEPIESPIHLTAAIVSGSPYERLSPSLGAFIYINRGRRDGVKVGTVLQQLDRVLLTDGPPVKKTTGLGTAMVVYASDAYSTAIITTQFDAIRVGSLLETVRPGLDRESQFKMLTKNYTDGIDPEAPAEKYISELDRIERDSDILSLSPEERERLERLHQQEMRRKSAGKVFPSGGESAALPNPAIEEGGAPPLPAAPNIEEARRRREEARKKRIREARKKARDRDEERLNQLFER